MNNRTFSRYSALLFFCVLVAGKGLAAESWGSALFQTKQHNFGRVALGSDAEFRFEFTNIYNGDVRLVNVRSSCGCTVAQIASPIIKPGETGAVIARLNTSGQHLRDKSAVLTVQMEAVVNNYRQIDTVQLFVLGYIRPDVLLTPGSVEFGAVVEGTAAERTVLLEYTGQPGWALMKVERSQPFIYARAAEVRRDRGNVTYRITVALKDDAPAGYIRDILRFTTNEMQSGKAEPVEILLPVQGVVTTPMRAKPSPTLIGLLVPGETVAKTLVIRSDAPFRITNVSSSDSRFRFAYSDQESAMQLVTLSFSAQQFLPGQAQDVAEVIHISTSSAEQKNIDVEAFVRIVEKR
jgi:hypothetical protein